MSKIVAIVTLYGNYNFGNKLQNYAVQRYFETRGFEVKTLTYWEGDHQLHTVNSLRTLASLIKSRIFDSNTRKRIRTIKSFSTDYLKLGEEVHYRRLDDGLVDRYDYFVCGSDQVWHCWSGDKKELEYFFLSFARPEQRITIAPSFGFSKFPTDYLDVYRNGIKGFRNINCREQEAADLIYELTGRDAMVVLDPTMLIDLEEWERIKKKPRNYSGKKYVLLYTIGEPPRDLRVLLSKYCSNSGIELIDLMEKNGDYYTSTRPDDFLYWIDNADLVISDSFHAAVFSILFKTSFLVFPRCDESGMGNRIDTLLEIFSLQERRIENNGNDSCFSYEMLISKMNKRIDFSIVDSVLNKEKRKADLFYEKCMKP